MNSCTYVVILIEVFSHLGPAVKTGAGVAAGMGRFCAAVRITVRGAAGTGILATLVTHRALLVRWAVAVWGSARAGSIFGAGAWGGCCIVFQTRDQDLLEFHQHVFVFENFLLFALVNHLDDLVCCFWSKLNVNVYLFKSRSDICK